MRLCEVGVLVGALLPMAAGFLDQRAVNDPVLLYLISMCYSDVIEKSDLDERNRELGKSKLPCEQVAYIRYACMANGTDEIDFLAEQQCVCGSSYWELAMACDNCFIVHGYQNYTTEGRASRVSSLSAAECTPSPPYQPFNYLLKTVNPRSLIEGPYMTLGVDQFLNNTEVSNYYTGTQTISLGEITGSATARQTTWFTGNWATFTPTTPPSVSQTGSTTPGATGTTATNEAVATPPGSSTKLSSSSGNGAAATGGINAYGSVLAAGLGIVAML